MVAVCLVAWTESTVRQYVAVQTKEFGASDVRTHKSKFLSFGTSFCSNSHYSHAVYRGLQMYVGVGGPYKKVHLPNSYRLHETIVFKKYTP